MSANQDLANDIKRLEIAKMVAPSHDGTFTVINYEDWGWSEEVILTLETQSDGSIKATSSHFDDALFFESYGDAWHFICEAEVARLSAALALKEISNNVTE